MSKNKTKKSIFKYMNKPLLIMTLIYAIVGAFLILDASSISSVLTYGNDTEYFYFNRQLLFIGISLIGSLVILKFDTGYYNFFSRILTYIFLGILIVTFAKNSLFSSNVSEVTLSLFGGSFQPAEFLKVLLIVYMASYFGSWVNKENHKRFGFIFPLVLAGTAFLIILLGGDYGSAAIMATLFALIFIKVPSDDKLVKGLKRFAMIGMICAVLVLKFSYLVIPQKVLESSSRLSRLIYNDPCDRYEEDTGYQVCNGYIAIDNGGLFGSGIGSSVQKYMYLPESHTDFIFPIIVEELGVIVGVAIIIGYLLIVFIVLSIAKKTSKLQNSLICYGVAIYFMLHVFINLGGVLGIIPVTGVPLPFLSYGGSFCLSIFASFAIVQRINIENEMKNNVKG